jgi:thymidylate kinase
MIVEFIGSTGAGKTTLASEVQRRLAGQARVVTSYQLAAKLLGLGRITHPTARNLVQDLAGLPFFIHSLYSHRAFVALVVGTLAREYGVSFSTANYARSIVRRIGMHELIGRHHRDQIVLVDEGTILSAHLLYVYTRAKCSPQELGAFAGLVPLPERIVYVKVPVDVLVRRALERSDARRELRSKDRRAIEEYVGRATEVFDRITELDRIRDRVLVVDNSASTEIECGMTVEHVARFILDRESGGEKGSILCSGQRDPGSMIGEMGVS